VLHPSAPAARTGKDKYPLGLASALRARLLGALTLLRNPTRPISILGLPLHKRLVLAGCVYHRLELDVDHDETTVPAVRPIHPHCAAPRPAPPRPRRRGNAMGKRSGGRKLPFFTRSSSSSSKRNRSARRLPSLPKQDNATRALLASPSAASPSATPGSAAAGQTAQLPPPLSVTAGGGVAVSGKVNKKKAGTRLWMRLDRWSASEIVELDKASIIRRAGLPPRDLRILGPVFSRSSSILGEHTQLPPLSLPYLIVHHFFCGDNSKKTQTLYRTSNLERFILQLGRRRW
jgi:hypothetical protein